MANVKTHRWYKTRYSNYTWYLFTYTPKYKSFGDVYVGYEFRPGYTKNRLRFNVMWSGGYDLPELVMYKDKIEELNEETNIEDLDHYKYINRITHKVILTIFENIDVSKLFGRDEEAVRIK